MNEMKPMTIGKFAERVSSTVQEINRWCDFGLIETPRRIGRRRVFGEQELQAVKEIREGKRVLKMTYEPLGEMTYNDVSEMTYASVRTPTSKGDAKMKRARQLIGWLDRHPMYWRSVSPSQLRQLEAAAKRPCVCGKQMQAKPMDSDKGLR